MGDRGNIVVLQDSGNGQIDQVWFYGHWSGYAMPGQLQEALKAGKGRWDDDSYLARIIFCRLLTPETLYNETGFGISCRLQDNEHPILVVDCRTNRVFTIEEEQLKNFKVPLDFNPQTSWTFQDYCELKKTKMEMMS